MIDAINTPGFYTRNVAPRLVHGICSCAPITRQRKQVVPLAEGVVLEIGIGSGLNLPLYNGEKVSKVIGIEPDPNMLRLSEKRQVAVDIDVEIVQGSAESMPLDDNLADTAMITYTLCTVPKPEKVLAEIKRVLKPTGRILLCEHGRSQKPLTARMQKTFDGVWGKLMLGCSLNRDPVALLEEAGFIFESLDNFVLFPFPAIVGTHYLGTAIAV